MKNLQGLGLTLMLSAGMVALPLAPTAAAHASATGEHDAVSRAYNNVGITDSGTLEKGQMDAAGSSFGAASLADSGHGPGTQVTVDGIDFRMPNSRPGTPDNIAPSAVPTTVKLRGQGNAIAFLATTTSGNQPFNVTVTYADKSQLSTFASTNRWTTAEPDPRGIVHDAFRVNGRNTPAGENADVGQPYGMFVSGVNIDPNKKVKKIEVSGNGAAHVFDAKIATIEKPFLVDQRGGRTPQPDSCDPLVQGQEICDGQESGTFEKADPSAHLQYRTARSELPQDASAFYNEITPRSSAPGTFFMTNGFNGGYFGIQELEDRSKIALFSIFGPQKGEVPDDRLSSQVLYKLPGAELVIHGEYAGGPSVRIPFDWKTGNTYATAITEQGDASDGNARIVSAWINKNPVGQSPNWTRLMTVRTERPKAVTHMGGLHSFVEDFVRDDQFTKGRARTASYGNAYTFSSHNNSWVPLSSVSFTGQMSRLFTIQNDAFPTPGHPCKITETVTGDSIPFDRARSHVNSIWDTADRSCKSPGRIAPVEAVRRGAPLYEQETFAKLSARVDGTQLLISGSPFADDEALSVSVDGKNVTTTATADDNGRLVDTAVALPGKLTSGTHEVIVAGKASGLSGNTTVSIP